MASISITKPPLAPPSHPPSSLNKSLFPQTSQLSLSKTNRFSPRRSKLTVSATAINEAQNNGGNHHNRAVVDRRNMLLTLGGAAITSVSSPSLAAPVAPDVLRPCVPTDNTDFNPPGSKGKLCCLDIDKHVPIRDFRFQDYPTVMKTRRAAHRVEWDGQFHRDFKDAIAAMRKLPDNDPCSLYMQSLIHCAYCDAVYKQVNYPDKRFMIHNGWLFYPFHRWELYFFERIAGSLIGKPDFALPFWAWDLEQGMRIPDIYEWDPSSSLYDATRDRTHPSKIVDLNADGVTNRNNLNDQQLIQQNLEAVKKQMTGNNNDINSELFYGGEYKAGDDKTPGAGTIENGAHTGVHVWTGGNMGEFWTAGKDPLFYALHGNVDRLWYVWEKKLKTRNSRHTEKDDYLNASFVFYDENRRPVRVTVRDCLDIEKLGYKYEDMPMPWLGESENQGPGGGGGGGWGPGGGGGGGDWGPGGGDWGPGGGGDWGPGGGGGDWGHGGGGWGGGGGGGDWGPGGGGGDWGHGGGGWGGGGGGGDWGHGGGGDWGGGGGGGDWGHGGGGGGDWSGGGGGGGGWGGGGWGG